MKIGNKSVTVWLREVFMVTIGSILYAMAVSFFLDPNSLAPGGVTGISVILNRLIPVETGTLIFLLNIPILLLGLWKFGWKLLLSSFYSIFVISIFTNLFQPLGAITDDKMLAALAGGALVAVSLGTIFKSGATSGGTDIIVKILRLKYPHLKTGTLFLALDAVIVATSAVVFRNIEVALYAGIVLIVHALLMDMVLYGKDSAKMLFIISDKCEDVAKRLLQELDSGVTYLDAKGAYTGKEKKVIMCVVKKHIAPKVEKIICEEDPNAFMIVSSATEIYGEGYKNILSEKI